MKNHIISIPPGSGKRANTYIEIFNNAPTCPGNQNIRQARGILYASKSAEIQNLDTKKFLYCFGPQVSRPCLLSRFKSVYWVVTGYESDQSELFEIEAVRRYYSYLQSYWPAWFFGADLESTCLLQVVLCLVPIRTVHRGAETIRVEVNRQDIQKIFENSSGVTRFLLQRAGIAKREKEDHLQAVKTYLGISEP